MCNCFNKVMLIVINVIFLLAGAGLAAIGIWVLVAQNSMFDFLNLLTKDVENKDSATMENYMNSTSTLRVAAYVAVAFGGFSLIVGFCGCCGAIKKNKCMLLIYAIAVSFILVAEIAGAVVAIVFKQQIGNELRPRLAILEKNHFLPLNLALNNTIKSSNRVNADITAYINYMQVFFQCCGVSNKSDITGPNTLWSNSSKQYNGLPQLMPVTCCKMKDNRAELLTKQDWNNIGNYLQDKTCPNTGLNYIETGCYDQVDGVIQLYSLPIIIVCIVVAVFEIACVIMACCMIHNIRKSKGHNV